MQCKFYPDDREKIKDKLWYTLKRVFSFRCWYNILIGGRDYGKTYSIKSFFIKDFIDNGHRFAWFRTTDIALDRIRRKEQFFGRLKNLEELGVETYDIKRDVIYINGQEAGYLFPIKTFHNIKGADYNVYNGCWDEFMRAKGEIAVHGKFGMFKDAVESVFRSGDKRVFLISNSTNKYDEVLAPFNLELKDYGIYLYREKKTLVHYIMSSEEHKKLMEGNVSTLLMSDAEKRYAVENKFTDFGDYGVAEKARYMFTVQTDDDKFVSLYMADGIMYVKDMIPKVKQVFKTLNPTYVNGKVTRLNNATRKIISDMYSEGRVLFVNGYCRDTFINDFVMYGR